MKKFEENSNVEYLAEFLISMQSKGFNYEGEDYQLADILIYYAKQIVELKDKIDFYERRVDNLLSMLTRKVGPEFDDGMSDSERKQHEQDLHMRNRGLLDALAEFDFVKYLDFIDSEDKDKIY